MELLINFNLDHEKIKQYEKLSDWTDLETRGTRDNLKVDANGFVDFFNKHIGNGEIVMSKKKSIDDFHFVSRTILLKEMISLTRRVTKSYHEILSDFINVYYMIEINEFTLNNLRSLMTKAEIDEYIQLVKTSGVKDKDLKTTLCEKFTNSRKNTQQLVCNIYASIYLLLKLGQI